MTSDSHNVDDEELTSVINDRLQLFLLAEAAVAELFPLSQMSLRETSSNVGVIGARVRNRQLPPTLDRLLTKTVRGCGGTAITFEMEGRTLARMGALLGRQLINNTGTGVLAF